MKLIPERAASRLILDPQAPRPKEWYFHQFDARSLIFCILRPEPNPVPKMRPWGTFVCERRYRVARSPEAEIALNVDKVVARYEVGVAGVRAGMGEVDVLAILGTPTGRNELGPFGSYDLVFPGVTVRFLAGRVAVIDRSSP